MPQPAHMNPEAYTADIPESVAQSGERVGVLLIHGYTGSVAETRPMGEYLASRGLAVRCPLLPGHGTTAEALTHIRWQQWADEVEAALSGLQECCDTVFVGGVSLGSLLTLWLGAHHTEIAGLIPMAPAIRLQNRLLPLTLLLRYVLRYNPFTSAAEDNLGDPEAVNRTWSYDVTPLWGAGEVYLLQRKVLHLLPVIRQPVLIFQGRRDPQLDPHAAQILCDAIGSTDKRVIWLENSGHNLLIDGERESAWARSYDWIVEHSRHGESEQELSHEAEGASQ